MNFKNPIVVLDDKLQNMESEIRAACVTTLWCCRSIVDTVMLSATPDRRSHLTAKLLVPDCQFQLPSVYSRGAQVI